MKETQVRQTLNSTEEVEIRTELEAPVIPETFPLESESSIRDSILFQPEIRQTLKPDEKLTFNDRKSHKQLKDKKHKRKRSRNSEN